jgi:TetR/AcrR family tetracycline transcriptional repressor
MVRFERAPMRKQRPRGSTTSRAVVEAALAVVDEVGIEGMTIRRVAEYVGAPPMSLYTHFSNKNELLDLMYLELAGQMYRDQHYESWQTELLALCSRIRSILLEHPGWAPLLSRPVPPLAISLRERVLKLMMAEGASSDQALRALGSAVLTSIGLALVELAFKGRDGESALERRYTRLKEWVDTQDAEAHDATRAAMARAPRFNLTDTFEYTARALIEGIQADIKRRKDSE